MNGWSWMSRGLTKSRIIDRQGIRPNTGYIRRMQSVDIFDREVPVPDWRSVPRPPPDRRRNDAERPRIHSSNSTGSRPGLSVIRNQYPTSAAAEF